MPQICWKINTELHWCTSYFRPCKPSHMSESTCNWYGLFRQMLSDSCIGGPEGYDYCGRMGEHLSSSYQLTICLFHDGWKLEQQAQQTQTSSWGHCLLEVFHSTATLGNAIFTKCQGKTQMHQEIRSFVKNPHSTTVPTLSNTCCCHGCNLQKQLRFLCRDLLTHLQNELLIIFYGTCARLPPFMWRPLRFFLL